MNEANEINFESVLHLTERAVSVESIMRGKCFLCGGVASSGAGEHIFPKWLQGAFGLWDKKLTLLNKTNIPYRQLTVPCCRKCNNETLAKLENEAQKVFEAGINLATRRKMQLGRWLAKILLGILTREARLFLDRSAPKKGTIVPPAFLEEYFHAHLILQSARKRTIFQCLHDAPFTLYLYGIEQDQHFSEFDFTSNVFGQSVAMRAGRLGAIFVSDGGLQYVAGARGPFALSGQTVHPIQFSELMARVHYKASLRDATHSYLMAETNKRIIICQQNVKSFSGMIHETGEERIFREWDELEFFRALERYMGPLSAQLFDPLAQECRTLLVDESGALVQKPITVRDKES